MNQPIRTNNKHGSPHKKHDSSPPPSSKKPVPRQSEKDNAKGNPVKYKGNAEQKINWSSWIQAVSTVIIVFITGFYTHYAGEQVDQVKKSIQVASDQFR